MRPEASQGKIGSFFRRQFAMTVYERRALQLIAGLVIFGSAVRLYQRSHNEKVLAVLNPPQIQSAGQGSGREIYFGRRININTAGVKELEALPGIGPKKAAAIVAWRLSNGRFQSITDLDRVPGIGAKTISRLSEFISVEPSDTISVRPAP